MLLCGWAAALRIRRVRGARDMARCHSTVLGVTNSAWAMSRLLMPATAIVATRSSAGPVQIIIPVHEVPAGHGPWFEDPAGCAKLVLAHFAATGFAPDVH